VSDQTPPLSPPPLAAPKGENLLEWAVGQYMAAKIQREHIMNYNGANLAYNHAANTARLLKIPDEQRALITPFPASTSINTITNPAPSTPSAPLSLGKLGLSMLAGAGLLGAGLGAGQYLAQDPAPPSNVVIEQPAIQPPAPPSSDGNVGFTIR
jgi:hypothetical protein